MRRHARAATFVRTDYPLKSSTVEINFEIRARHEKFIFLIRVKFLPYKRTSKIISGVDQNSKRDFKEV